MHTDNRNKEGKSIAARDKGSTRCALRRITQSEFKPYFQTLHGRFTPLSTEVFTSSLFS